MTTTSAGGDGTGLPVIPVPRPPACPLQPAAEFAQWRKAEGLPQVIWRGQKTWVISRYDDIRAALVDPRLSADTIPDTGPRRWRWPPPWQTVPMAQITLRGNPINTVGELPPVGSSAPAFTLTGTDLGAVSSEQFRGKPVVLNIFPSVDTPVCATSVRTFNERAAGGGLSVLCVSKDLPFAQARFCGAEGIENVTTASAFRDSFGEDYGITITDGPMAGLLARAIVVIGADGNVAYTELVPEIAQEPNYDAALASSSA